MAGTPSLFAGIGAQLLDNNGNPLSGGKLYTYLAGTTTPIAVYTTEAANVAHPNPIILDSAGRVPSGEIWLKEGDAQYYKFVVSTSADVVLNTYDFVPGTYNSQILNDFIADLADPTGASLVGFIQTGTGAVATTVLEKAREWFSPHDFGAVGNSNATGTTGTNDSAAFALLEAEQSGGVVNLDNKFYLVSSPIPTKNNYINGKFVLANGTTDDQPNNLSLGYEALFSNTYVPLQWPAGGGIDYASGNYNTAFGDAALRANTTGRRNTAIGTQALYTNGTGYYNTAVGPLAMYSCTSGYENTAVGVQALQSNTNGHDNVAIGSGALTQGTTVNYNIAIGRQALQLATSTSSNVAIGFQAMLSYDGGGDSIGIGYQALSAPGSNGLYNVAIGSASLGQTTTGTSNVAIGRRAANAATTGSGNVAVGNDALVGSGVANTGSGNVAIGNTALPNVTSGDYNIAIGASAGTGIGAGIGNVVVGRASGTAITSGSYNIAIGEQTLTDVTTGTQNTAVGTAAQAGGAAFTNTTVLGYGATGTASDQVTLGNSSVSSLRCQVSLTVVSDERDKVKTAEMPGLAFVKEIDTFVGKWDKRDNSKNPDGTFAFLSAQNLQSTQSKFNVDLGLVDSTNPEQLAATYERLIPSLVKAIQELSAEVETLKAAK